MNVVKKMFLRIFYRSLVTSAGNSGNLRYEYAMIPYILSENPEADNRDMCCRYEI